MKIQGPMPYTVYTWVALITSLNDFFVYVLEFLKNIWKLNVSEINRSKLRMTQGEAGPCETNFSRDQLIVSTFRD